MRDKGSSELAYVLSNWKEKWKIRKSYRYERFGDSCVFFLVCMSAWARHDNFLNAVCAAAKPASRLRCQSSLSGATTKHSAWTVYVNFSDKAVPVFR